MKGKYKKTILIFGLSILALTFGFFLNSCAGDTAPTTGKDRCHILTVKNIENLKILFGEGYLYSGNEIFDIEVSSSPSDNLYSKKDKIEYMPELITMEWSEAFSGYTVRAFVSKEGIRMPDDEKTLTKIGNYNVYLFGTETPAFSESEKYVGAMFLFENGGYFFAIDDPDDMPSESEKRGETVAKLKQILSEYILQLDFYEVSA